MNPLKEPSPFLERAALVLAFTVVSCQASADVQRGNLKSSVSRAQTLAREVSAWSDGFRGKPIPGSVTQTVNSYRNRASSLREEILEVSEEAKRGIDLTGLSEALEQLATFDIEALQSASESSRTELINQFATSARNVKQAAARLVIRTS